VTERVRAPKEPLPPTTVPTGTETAQRVSDAWFGATGQRVDPAAVRSLKEEKFGIFVLPARTAGEPGVIAKCGPSEPLRHEVRYYRDIAPLLPVVTVRLLGATVDDDETWLFLEDVGRLQYDNSAEHRAALTRWLAAVHVATAELDLSAFPPAGSERFRTHLHAARDTIRANLGNPSLQSAERRELERITGLLDRVDERWPAVESALTGAPSVLVHGDLVAKNIHVGSRAGRTDAFPFDWEMVGHGVPAVDLGTTEAMMAPNPDLDDYLHRAAVLYPGWIRADIERVSAIGTLFRCLAGMDWISLSLAYEWVDKPMRDLPLYATIAVDCAERAGIGSMA